MVEMHIFRVLLFRSNSKKQFAQLVVKTFGDLTLAKALGQFDVAL